MSEAGGDEVIRGRTVLVTGGTGFVGRALIQRLAGLGPARVRILSQSQTGGSELLERLRGTGLPVEILTGDVADPYVVRRAVDGANVIFHLAAMKYVDRCESQPYQAVKTNVIGSKVLADAASQERAVTHFIAISSDKAVDPVGVYGMTKWLMERLVCEMQSTDGPAYSVVRCGNIWGSTASVETIWLRSIREGRELLVTDPQMTRFVMRSGAVVDLLLAAAGRGLRGEILVPPMAVYVLGDLAAAFAERHGTTVRVVGPRPGEKLHDDLISASEARFTRREGDEFIITPGRDQAGSGPVRSLDAVPLSREQLAVLLDAEDVAVG